MQDDSEAEEKRASERGSQAINRALSILGLFSVEMPNMNLTDICAATGLTMPTAHRMVRTLVARDYLVQDPSTGRYALGPMLLNVAQIVLQTSAPGGLVVAAAPHIENLRNLTEETVGLHVLGPAGRICVAEVPSRHAMRMSTGLGTLHPAYAGAASKALLSAIPPSERSALLDRQRLVAITAQTMTSRDDIDADIAAVTERGYAMSLGETVEGAGALAAPIRSATHEVIGAINITGPLSRWTQERMIATVPLLLTEIRALELRLGRTSG
ncbi:MAG TPA: IclR family transcriptional regulator [Ilumatobacter sp.]|nr:IclR family transcriptional regulator [Ilumatobacter sp.]